MSMTQTDDTQAEASADTCWVCLKPGELIEPCTKCRGLIHLGCLSSYQTTVTRPNECGACRSDLKPGWHAPVFTTYQFDFDSFRVEKRSGDVTTYHVTGVIGFFEVTFVFRDRWVLVRCALKHSSWAGFHENDLVFTDDEIRDAMAPKRTVFPENCNVLEATANLTPIEHVQFRLKLVRKLVHSLNLRKRGNELKRISAERRASVKRRHT